MYLAVWLSEVIFPIAGREVRSGCIYLACKMAFGVNLALALALVSYLCTRLNMIGFLVRCAKPYNRYYGEHLLYAWFVYHCRGLHRLGNQLNLLFYRAITNDSGMNLLLPYARRAVVDLKNYDIRKRLVMVRDLECTGLVSQQCPMDKTNSKTWILPLRKMNVLFLSGLRTWSFAVTV